MLFKTRGTMLFKNKGELYIKKEDQKQGTRFTKHALVTHPPCQDQVGSLMSFKVLLLAELLQAVRVRTNLQAVLLV